MGGVTAPSQNVPPMPPPSVPIIAPSLLAVDFDVDAARRVDPIADWLHIDIMDGQFVTNRTIGIDEVRALRAATSSPFDTHLMIVDPHDWASRYAEAGSDHVTFHAEAAHDPIALAKDIRAAGARPGLAIDRDTPVEPYLELLPHVDLLLIMTIKAGLGGQEFLPHLLEKVRTARAHRDSGHLELRLEVDGGIAADTIEQAALAGADTFVAGTAVFAAPDPQAVVRRLRELVHGVALWPTDRQDSQGGPDDVPG
jgi:ribulose-phosphate 3-epimerase